MDIENINASKNPAVVEARRVISELEQGDFALRQSKTITPMTITLIVEHYRDTTTQQITQRSLDHFAAAMFIVLEVKGYRLSTEANGARTADASVHGHYVDLIRQL